MAEKINDGGAAFPSGNFAGYEPKRGLSIRDYFAAAALQGHITTMMTPHGAFAIPENERNDPALFIARLAYEFADAMIAARARGES